MQRALPSKAPLIPIALLTASVALVVVTVALGAWLDGDAGWTQATAAVGLVATVVAAGVLLATAQGWTNGARLSLAAVATAVVGMGAIGLTVITYLGGASDAGLPGGDSAARKTTEEGAALSQQVSNNQVQPPGYAHDVGSHPTFDEFMSLDTPTILRKTPGGALTPAEVETLKGQLAEARAFAETVDTFEKAQAAGYMNTTNDVPFMGAHLISRRYVADGVFDPGKPEGLLFSKLGNPNGEWQLVGVWYLLIPGINRGVTETVPPEGFAGNLELWHEHHGLCFRAGIISENNTRAGCLADNGRWVGDLRWMIHVWVWPETADNPEGVFTYLNNTLFQKQQRVQAGP